MRAFLIGLLFVQALPAAGAPDTHYNDFTTFDRHFTDCPSAFLWWLMLGGRVRRTASIRGNAQSAHGRPCVFAVERDARTVRP